VAGLNLSNSSKFQKGTIKRLRVAKNKDDFEQDFYTKFLNGVIDQLHKSMIEKDNIASKYLYQSFRPYVERSGDFRATLRIMAADYWDDVDKGTKPHDVPWKAIERWTNTKRSLKFANDKQQARFVFNTVKKITKKGTKGSGFASEVLGYDNEILEREAATILEQMFSASIEVEVITELKKDL
jgi:hypothetical protein